MDVLVFDLQQMRYAVPSAAVVEIVRAVALVPVAGAPRGVEGIFSLRGRLIPVVDLRSRLGLSSKPLDPTQHFVLVAINRTLVALRVDQALSLMSLDESTIDSDLIDVQAKVTPEQRIAGVVTLDDGLVVIYDVEAFLSQTEASELGSLLDTYPAGLDRLDHTSDVAAP